MAICLLVAGYGVAMLIRVGYAGVPLYGGIRAPRSELFIVSPLPLLTSPCACQNACPGAGKYLSAC